MATACASAKRKPVFIKVDQLKPGIAGHTLTVKVVSSKPVQVNKPRGTRSLSTLSQPSRPPRIAECLVGDETGTIYFTARNEQDVRHGGGHGHGGSHRHGRDFHRKRHREDDRHVHEPSKRSSDYESMRHSDHDSRQEKNLRFRESGDSDDDEDDDRKR